MKTYIEWAMDKHQVKPILEELGITIVIENAALTADFAGSPGPFDPQSDIEKFLQQKLSNFNSEQISFLTDFLMSLGATATLCLGAAGCMKIAELLGLLPPN